jgi:hypothetical protein
MSRLVLKRARASRPSRQWRDDDYDVLENGVGYEPTREAAMSAFAKSWRRDCKDA